MRTKGFTLIELLVVLGITSLITFFAIPAFNNLFKATQSKTAINSVISLINLTRQTAISNGQLTSICGSQDGINCEKSWGNGVLIFTDVNRNGHLDGSDTVIQFRHLDLKGTLEWSAFQNKNYLQFRSNGFTNYHNGSLTYCPFDKDMQYARQLIINVGGRIRKAHDSDANGIPNTANGKDLEC